MRPTTSAVLLSAGLDSAVLAALEARSAVIHPIYVASGLAWEAAERRALKRLLASPVYAGSAPLVELTLPVADVYPSDHWALAGDAPAFDTPDEDVYLAGRNVLLLGKAAVHCARHGIPRLALGSLAGNPFPDATAQFFSAMARALSIGLAHEIEIATPLATLHKPAVVKLGETLQVPFAHTLSCMSPEQGQHCGRCSKCRERRDAFREAKAADPTRYVSPPLR
ncbi:MAG: 7-cyano-7-deazaguanine synthase [Acidimicrobiia bacterium]|nr:7-cyano-7-deazaguanine synthase [Acidimicrobiia bacterium]